MKPLIEITTSNGQFYYDLFYFSSLIILGIFFMIDGKQKKYPITEWSLILTSGIIFLIIGTKLAAYTMSDWKELLATGTFPYTERKLIFGGLLGLFGVWIAKKLIKFPHPIFDSFAIGLPLAVAIQRLGCFMVGCCFGTPTDIPWAVSYTCDTHPFYTHLSNGLISENSLFSLPVHPVQLYQTFLSLIIAVIIWKIRKVWKQPGNLLLSFIALNWLSRFIVEFWRDSSTNGIGGTLFLGIKYLQWALLLAILLVVILIYIREKSIVKKINITNNQINPVWFYILLFLFIYISRNWFTKTEYIVIEFLLAQASIFMINKLLKSHSEVYKYRLISVYSLIFILILNVSVTAQRSIRKSYDEETAKVTYNDISIGYGNLQYSHYHHAPTVTSNPGCNATTYNIVPSGSLYSHNSNVIGLKYTHTEATGMYNKFTLSAAVSGGNDIERYSNPINKINIYDISPMLKYDTKWVGLSIGFHSGVSIDETYESLIRFSLNNNQKSYLAFTGGIRLFPYDLFYCEGRINDVFPYQIGFRSNTAYQFIMGSGMGFTNGNCLEFGVDGNADLIISANALIKERFGLRATFYSSNNIYTSQMLQFSLSYRITPIHVKR